MRTKEKNLDVGAAAGVPFRQRTSIRSLASALGVPKSTMHKRIKEGVMRPTSNPVKPFLTDANKLSRLQHCISMLDPASFGGASEFKGMFYTIHIDEKWFYMSRTSNRYYMLPEEEEPHRTCKSKRFITKVMFLAAVARPRWDSSRNQYFDGKLGIFPFVVEEKAKRKSKNRPAGTIETKAIVSVTKTEYRDALINQLLPQIQSKWPNRPRGPIWLQQDNAKPHIDQNDVSFKSAVSGTGLDIRLTNQPPNSPDLNVLDLDYFRAIQSLQHQQAPTTIDELIAAVKQSFNDLSREKLNSVFLSLQQCMIEIMKVGGGNNYKQPHMGKEKLQREGLLPTTLTLDSEILSNVRGQFLGLFGNLEV